MTGRYVFISYSSARIDSALSVQRLIEAEGVSTWMAPRDIPPGEDYGGVIEGAIENCSCFLLLLTRPAMSSEWIPKEIERAINYKKPVIPVMLENVELSKSLKFYISTYQVIQVDRIDKSSRGAQQLLEKVKECCGLKSGPTSGPKPNLKPVVIGFVVILCAVAIIGIANPFTNTSKNTSTNTPANTSQNTNTNNSSKNSSSNTNNSAAKNNSSNTNNSAQTNKNTNINSSNTNKSSTTEKSVKVQTKDGKTLSGTVRVDSSGYVIADSSTREYTKSELQSLNLNAAELCIARNEIYARLGYDFSNSGLQSYFDSCSWYKNSGNKPSLTGGSAAEKNSNILLEMAKENSTASAWTDLATS